MSKPIISDWHKVSERERTKTKLLGLAVVGFAIFDFILWVTM